MEQFRGKSPTPPWEKGGVLGALQTYPQKPLQELPGAVDVDAGDVAIAPQHAIHRGGHILPVLLCLGVKLKLVLHHLAGHAGRGHAPAGDSLLPWDGRTPNQQGMSQLCHHPTSVCHPFPLPRATANSKILQLRARRNKDLNPVFFWRPTSPKALPGQMPQPEQAGQSLAEQYTQLYDYFLRVTHPFHLFCFSLPCLNILQLTCLCVATTPSVTSNYIWSC